MPTQTFTTRTPDIALPIPTWYRTGQFWKRFSVTFSVILSAIALILSAIASLRPGSREHLRALTIAGIIINSVSIALSALTSLDWKLKSTNERQFAEQLLKYVELQDGDSVTITREGLVKRLTGGVQARRTA